MAGDVKFIRVRGRVVPVRGKGASGSKGPKPKKKAAGMPDNKARGTILNKLAASDRKLAKTGRTVAKFAATGAVAAGVGAVAKKSGGLGVLAGALGLFAMTNSGFASGREMSATIQAKAAKKISKGKKVSKADMFGIGGASDRARSNVRYVQKASKKDINYFRKKLK